MEKDFQKIASKPDAKVDAKKFMPIAVMEAKRALKSDEVPIGAVIVKDGKIVSKGRNCREKKEKRTLACRDCCHSKSVQKTA